MAFPTLQKSTGPEYRLPATTSQSREEYVASSAGPAIPEQVATATDISSLKQFFPLDIEGHVVFYADMLESLRTTLQNEHRYHGDSSQPTQISFEAAVSALTSQVQGVAPTWFKADPDAECSFAAVFDYAPLYSFIVAQNPLNVDTSSLQIPYHVDGDRSRIRLTVSDGVLSIASIVRHTTRMPSITPADEVYTTPGGTKIVHGPGRETRVRDKL